MQLPLVPLRDVVIFPGVVTSLFVGRDKSIKSLQTAMESDKSVMLVAQKNSSQENPKVKDLYEVGSVSTILQLIKLPDGTYKVLVEGIILNLFNSLLTLSLASLGMPDFSMFLVMVSISSWSSSSPISFFKAFICSER